MNVPTYFFGCWLWASQEIGRFFCTGRYGQHGFQWVNISSIELMVLQVHITTGQVFQEWGIVLSVQFLPKMGSSFRALGIPPGCSLASHVPVYNPSNIFAHVQLA